MPTVVSLHFNFNIIGTETPFELRVDDIDLNSVNGSGKLYRAMKLLRAKDDDEYTPIKDVNILICPKEFIDKRMVCFGFNKWSNLVKLEEIFPITLVDFSYGYDIHCIMDDCTKSLLAALNDMNPRDLHHVEDVLFTCNRKIMIPCSWKKYLIDSSPSSSSSIKVEARTRCIPSLIDVASRAVVLHIESNRLPEYTFTL